MKEVYDPTDLSDRALLDAGAERPARLAVIGQPISHSASPRMHQAALDAEGIAVRYVRIEVPPGGVGETLARMRELDFIGCNVTVPHKLEVMAACDEVDPRAAALGAVNTVRFDADATRGFNTDGPGFAAAVAETLGLELRGLRVAILGAGGGAGRALAAHCALEGAAGLVLVNRTVAKITELTDHIGRLGLPCEIRALSFDHPDLQAMCQRCDLIVNASSVGLKAGDPAVVPAACLRPDHAVFDCIYQPPVTPLLALAAARSCAVANGRLMLIHQGALAFRLWFPGSNPLPRMKAALP
jgi:shikimate dehydrogenase